MSLLLNLLWLILGGAIATLGFFLFGFLLCITIIGIPFGIQAFYIGKSYAMPFGKQVIALPNQSIPKSIVNALWLILFGWILFLFQLIIGIVLCVTIIGIPFGLQHFKLLPVVCFPFSFELV